MHLALSVGMLSLAGLCMGAHPLHIDGATSTFRDAKNNTLLWHGVNFVEKSSPYYPVVNSTHVAAMKSLGMNVARIGVMMPGVFPKPDKVPDEDYLKAIDGIIDTLWRAGIWTIIDLHQDVISPVVCGEGTPDWMVNFSALGSLPLPQPLNKSAPVGSCAPTGVLKPIGWSELYLTDACGKVFQDIYEGKDVIGEMFGRYWETVAARYHGRGGVLAYELMNEPWYGDIYAHPELMALPGKGETEYLGPWMERMHGLVRKHDPDTPTLFAPAEINNRLMRHVGYEAGFLPGEPMAFHTYCVTGTDGAGPTSRITKEVCHVNDKLQVHNREQDLKRLRTAGFVTEFGAVSDEDTGRAEVRYVLDRIDGMSPPASWAFWDYNLVHRTSDLYKKELARSYARQVPGTLISTSFDVDTGLSSVVFAPSAEGGEAHIFLSKQYQFTEGWAVTVTPAEGCAVADVEDGIVLTVAPGNTALQITVKVARK